MRNFFASLFGALIGIFLAFFLIFIIIVGMITNAVKSFKEEKISAVAPQSVLEIRLNRTVKERTTEKPFNFRFDDNEKIFTENSGLNDIIADIRHAATDNKIKGIFLNLSDVPSGIATLENIRTELQKFKENSHKFIVAYSAGYTQKSYYLASVADNVYLYPEGEIIIKGLSAQVLFYKKALDKLGIDVQVFRHGRYKSFVEPFILDKMSADNKLQTRMLLNSVWDKIVGEICASRKIPVADLNRKIDDLAIHSAQLALDNKLVDSLLYPDQVLNQLKMKTGISTGNISFIGLDDYRATFNLPYIGSSKIAVIYATGDIVQGEGDDENIGSKRISETIRTARLNSDVKAIVLRVNSPGGDALASDVIWREVDLAKKVKPVVVSMGDVAASGGYYISCDADEIVAEPTTISGSIGVFGLIPDCHDLFSDKLGITVDTVSTNTHSAAGSVMYSLQPEEAAVLQGGIENIYHTFLTRVADGRKIALAEVDSIAQGRVWSGEQALKIGLVDTLGDTHTAIRIAAQKANLTSYSIEEMPAMFSPFRKLFQRYTSDADYERAQYIASMQHELGQFYEPVMELEKTLKLSGIQARMPYQLIIE